MLINGDFTVSLNRQDKSNLYCSSGLFEQAVDEVVSDIVGSQTEADEENTDDSTKNDDCLIEDEKKSSDDSIDEIDDEIDDDLDDELDDMSDDETGKAFHGPR